MATWREPKSNYVASDQVTPSIFNELAENEQYLYDIRCQSTRKNASSETPINEMVYIKDGDLYIPKTRKNGVTSNMPLKVEHSHTTENFKEEWTEVTPGTTVLAYGVYLVKVDIKDDSSGIGGYGTMFVDTIAMYSDASTEFEIRSFELPSTAIHFYIANNYEA